MPDEQSLLPDPPAGETPEMPQPMLRERIRLSDRDGAALPPGDEPEQPYWTCRRVVLVLVTLLVIFALLAVMILPGILEARRQAELENRPTPTYLPSV